MGKFNISTTKSGELTDVAKLAHADLPVNQEETVESTPPGPSIEQLMTDLPEGVTPEIVGEGVAAGIEREQEIAAEQEREFVPDIITRRDDPTRVDFYQRKTPTQEATEQDVAADGGLAARARNMANKIDAGDVRVKGLGPHGNNIVKDTLNAVGVVNPEGNVDKGFLQMMSVITENTIADIAFNEGIDVKHDLQLTPETQVDTGEVQGRQAVAKTQNNEQLGKQLNREWHKYNNRVQGNPQGPIPEITNDQAIVLGDVAKELYYETNKVSEGNQFMVRSTTPDGQVAFTVTKHGSDLLKKGAQKRKRMFPKQHVRPTKTPTPGGQLVGEGRVYTKRVSSKIKKPIAGAQVINQAMSNLNKVPNVVDKQRLKILLATALPILSGEIADSSHPFAGLNHVGKDKTDKFSAKQANDADFDAEQNYVDLIDQLAQDVYGIARERNGANYLTYYMQGFTGRIAPQQTHFDPTSSKSVRFVTRNAVPSMATPGSRVERNLRQMYAMMLVPGADKLLPAEREIALERYAGTLVKYGQKLDGLLNGITDAQVEAAAEAIANGVPVNDPNFPKLPSLSLDPVQDADLIKAIQDKGEDGQAFIDGAIDFSKYYKAKLDKKPYASYFNAYMDGKTNGLASNGIQMGSENVAYKTGVIRTQNKTLLDNDVDLRDDLRDTLLESIDQEGFDGMTEATFGNSLPVVASKVFSNRDLNKSTTMTFGYGMELGSFKKVIEEHMDVMAHADPELKEAIDGIVDGDSSKKAELVETLHTKYVSGLVKVLDPNALQSRSIMKSAAIMHALTNELFTIRSHTGLELAFGGTEYTGSEIIGSYDLVKGDKKPKRTVIQPTEEATAAADKRRVDEEGNLVLEPGAIATGGAAVGPIQSLDAATVAMTASGKSWGKLRNASNGNPYLHTIYDAFKVDAMGYDVVLNETNNNWLDAGMNWSYLEETRNAIDSLRERFAEKYQGKPNSTPLSDAEWKMAGYLLAPITSAKGHVYPGNLKRILSKTMNIPVDADSDTVHDVTTKAYSTIISAMSKAGYNFKKPDTQPTLGHLKTFIGAFNEQVQLSHRLGSMINKTNENKSKLKAKIKRDGNKVYQYYSH